MKKEIFKTDSTELKLTAHQISNLIKVNTNTRAYIEHKYKDKEMTETEWKTNLKKDGLSF